jgi:hypothetical protein
MQTITTIGLDIAKSVFRSALKIQIPARTDRSK